MKKIYFIVLLALISLSSCIVDSNYGRDGLDGESFLKFNYEDGQPSFVNTDGAIPYTFNWNTYYRTDPGFYTVHFEYERYTTRGRVVYPYDVEIEVFNFLGEPGDYNYNGRDGDDVYFELVLFSDGSVDYFHDIIQKSENLDSISNKTKERTMVTQKQIIKNGKGVKYTYYKYTPYLKE